MFFNNYEVVERQRIVGVLLRSTPSGFLNLYLYIEPEFHSGLFTFDSYRGRDSLVLLDWTLNRISAA